MKHLLSKFVLMTLALLGSLGQANAMTLTPIEASLTATGRGSSYVFRLHNDSADPIAVDLYAKKRAMNRDGSDLLTDADSDFTIVPAQASLQPGQVQSVRIQYVGNPSLAVEQAYRFIAEQLPLETASEAKVATTATAGVKILIKYITSVYVTAGKTKADVVPVSVTSIPAKDKQAAMLKVVLKNNGDAHIILKDTKLTFIVNGQTVTLTSDQLKGLEKENILAKTEREFTLAMPPNMVIQGSVNSESIKFVYQ